MPLAERIYSESIFKTTDTEPQKRKRNKPDKAIQRESENMKLSYLDSPIYDEEAMQRIYTGIAQNIKIQLDKEGLSLRDLEMKSGVCFSHISRMISGNSKIGLDALIRIAYAFEMSPTDFFPYDKNKRMTNGQKFDEITKCLDIKSCNFLLEQCINFTREWRRLTNKET